MGLLEVHHLDSPVLARRRKLRVWTPEGLDRSGANFYNLLIQQDGQIAFSDRDAELPFGSWRLEVEVERLMEAGAIPPTIIVGVDNSPLRRKEYAPTSPEFEPYQTFVVGELLPWIREHYPVSFDPSHTALMGSSMGGLVSFALAANHPDLFGNTACLSPWFEHEQNAYIHNILRPMAAHPGIRVYMDSGIRDWRWLDDGHRGMLLARVELMRLGFAEGGDLDWMVDLHFPSVESLEGSLVKPEKRGEATYNQHNEYQWNRRLPRALKWVLQR